MDSLQICLPQQYRNASTSFLEFGQMPKLPFVGQSPTIDGGTIVLAQQ